MGKRDEPQRVSVESLANGTHREISRFVAGGRALLFCVMPDGDLALVTVVLDRNGDVDRVLTMLRIWRTRIDELDAALVTARKGLGNTA